LPNPAHCTRLRRKLITRGIAIAKSIIEIPGITNRAMVFLSLNRLFMPNPHQPRSYGMKNPEGFKILPV
jgi:hypothetical protein